MVTTPSELVEIFENHVDDYKINYDSPFGDGHSAEKIYDVLKKFI